MSLLKLDSFTKQTTLEQLVSDLETLQSQFEDQVNFVVIGSAIVIDIANNVPDEKLVDVFDVSKFIIGVDCQESQITKEDMKRLDERGLINTSFIKDSELDPNNWGECYE